MKDNTTLIARLYDAPPARPVAASNASPADKMFPSIVKPAVKAPAEIPRALPAHVAEWERQVMASSLAPTLPDARTFLHRHATPELLEMLSVSGAGSHPAVIGLVANSATTFNAINPEAKRDRALRSLYPSATGSR